IRTASTPIESNKPLIKDDDGTDIAKISRKRSKPDNHRHETDKECTRAEDLIARKVKSYLQSTLGQLKSTY
ncbi:hypothetical protein Tco_0498468, partial [Tanacetum coccineum]